MISVVVYCHYIGELAGKVSLMESLDARFRWFINSAADFQAYPVAGFKQVTGWHDFNCEIIDFTRCQPLGVGVCMKWLPRF